MGAILIAAQLVQLGIPIAQEIIDAVNAEMSLSGSGAAPTAAQQASIDAGFAAAHAALQAATPAVVPDPVPVVAPPPVAAP